MRFLRTVKGRDRVDDLSVSVLNKDALMAYQAAKLAELGDKDSTRRTIASTLRQVRSVVQPRLVQSYKIKCPDFQEFRVWYLGKVPIKDVPLPPYALRLATARAARRLWLRRDPLYLVWLMAYGLGMRADEMACARWSWIETHMGAPRMALRDRPEEDFRVKGVRPGNVPVHPAVLRRLQAFKAEGSTFILPRDGYIGRVNLIQRDFSAWMTSLGWDKVDTSKRAHELRRLFGSRVWAKHGKEECFVRMRHMSFSTTERSYLNMNLDLTRRELVGI
jgi:integrase